jgi:hypothetical protein
MAGTFVVIADGLVNKLRQWKYYLKCGVLRCVKQVNERVKSVYARVQWCRLNASLALDLESSPVSPSLMMYVPAATVFLSM